MVFWCVLVVQLLLALGVQKLFTWWHAQRWLKVGSPPYFVPYALLDPASTLVVDCTHPKATALITHHKGGAGNFSESLLVDSSTDAVFNAIRVTHPFVKLPFCSADHFDIDSFTSVFALQHPAASMEHEAVVRVSPPTPPPPPPPSLRLLDVM